MTERSLAREAGQGWARLTGREGEEGECGGVGSLVYNKRKREGKRKKGPRLARDI